MRKRTRTILFLSLFFLFVLFAPAVILYSQGYRFDFEKRKITQTGAIFLQIEPKQTEIYINGELVKKTDFFFGSALLENLLPGDYKITLKKEGYYLWEKNLGVEEKQVTEVKNIILVPSKIDFTVLSKNIEDFWIAPDGKKAVFLEKNIPPETGWALKLYDLEKNVKSYLIGLPMGLLNLEWSPDSKEIYLDINGESFGLRLDKLPLALIKRTALSSPKNVLIIFGDYTFSREEETLYFFNKDSQTFEKLLEGVKDLKTSPDNKKLVFFSPSEIWIFYLKDKTEMPTKKAGERQFLVRLSERIGDVFWLNNNYLILSAGNKIRISETDERDRINISDLENLENPKMFFNLTDKKLYIQSGNNLSSSEKLNY
ncbi:MAG: hypothetical protein Q7R46_01710 [bacterium]|nr:hypothetical protein [bacterium]